METKKWYQSKTVFANVAVVAVALFTNFISGPDVKPETVASIVASVNLVLRFISFKGLSF